MSTLSSTAPTQRSLAVPDKIAVAIDLADTEYLVQKAADQARACGAAITLIHVIQPADSLPLDPSAIPYVDAAEMERDTMLTLQEIESGIRAEGVPCSLIVRYGNPSEVIPEVVRGIGATRLILGTHGRRNWKKLLLGSVANELIQRIDIPVYTIGPFARAAASPAIPRKILHPISLANGYQQSARLAIEIAQFHKADLTLLHIVDRNAQRGCDSALAMERTESELQKLIPDEAPLWICTTIHVETGETVEQILNAADQAHADLIILGVSGDVSFWPIKGDTTAYKIIAQAKCPVLTIRHSVPTEKAKRSGSVSTLEEIG